MNDHDHRIRDFIYLDLPKIASIFSQLTGGLVTGTEIVTGDESDQRNIRKYDLKIFTPEFGGMEKKISQMTESRIMHHDLFKRLEQLLFEKGYSIDINKTITVEELESGESHRKFEEIFYIRCTGWSLFEDYEKMKAIAKNHNILMQFIRKSALSSIKESAAYKELVGKIEAEKAKIRTEKDRNKKAILKNQLKALEKQLHTQLESSIGGEVEEWIIDGFSNWVDIFIKEAIYFHIYPFDNYGRFHIKAALKRNSFVDGDIKFTDFAYTGRPNLKLTLFGLVTSVPPKGKHPFDLMSEFEDHKPKNEQDDPIGFEAAFRGLFRGFDGLDNLSKFERYPNLTVYPLAIFRDIYPKNK